MAAIPPGSEAAFPNVGHENRMSAGQARVAARSIKIGSEHQYKTPCGRKMLNLVLVSNQGHRVGKVSGDLNNESRESIIGRAVEACKS